MVLHSSVAVEVLEDVGVTNKDHRHSKVINTEIYRPELVVC